MSESRPAKTFLLGKNSIFFRINCKLFYSCPDLVPHRLLKAPTWMRCNPGIPVSTLGSASQRSQPHGPISSRLRGAKQRCISTVQYSTCSRSNTESIQLDILQIIWGDPTELCNGYETDHRWKPFGISDLDGAVTYTSDDALGRPHSF